MNYLMMAKGVVGLVTTTGTGMIVKQIIKNTTPEGTSKLARACMSLSGAVIAVVVNKPVTAYVEEQFDNVDTMIKGFMNKNKQEEAK